MDVVRRVIDSPISVKESPRMSGNPPVLVASSEMIKKKLDWKPRDDDLKVIIKTV